METDGSAVAVLGHAVWCAGHLLPVLLALPQRKAWLERAADRPGHGCVPPGRSRWPAVLGLPGRPHRRPKGRAGCHHARDGAWLRCILARQELRRAVAGLDVFCRVLHQPHSAGPGAWPRPFVPVQQLALRVGAGVRVGRLPHHLLWLSVFPRRRCPRAG